MTTGHNIIRSVHDRWLRLEEDKRAVGEDLKDLFAEAKANGFDTKALRAAFRMTRKRSEDAAAVEEHEAIVDTYMAALIGTIDAPARIRATREEPPAKPEETEAVVDAVPVDDAGSRPAGGRTPAEGHSEPTAGGSPAPDDEPDIPAFLRRSA